MHCCVKIKWDKNAKKNFSAQIKDKTYDNSKILFQMWAVPILGDTLCKMHSILVTKCADEKKTMPAA